MNIFGGEREYMRIHRNTADYLPRNYTIRVIEEPFEAALERYECYMRELEPRLRGEQRGTRPFARTRADERDARRRPDWDPYATGW